MHVPLTNGIIPLYILSHLPPLPMIIYYRGRDAAEDDSEVHYTIQQRVRMCRIILQIPSHTLDKLTVPLDEKPGSLSISCTSRHPEDTKIMISTPNLLHLTSHGTCLPKILPLLDSAFSLVTPKSTDIQSPGYLTWGTLLIQLQNAPIIEELSIVSNFSVSRPPVYPRPLWPISVSNPKAEWTCEDWRDLIYRMIGHDNDDLCIFATYRPSLTETACPSVSYLEHSSRVRHVSHAPLRHRFCHPLCQNPSDQGTIYCIRTPICSMAIYSLQYSTTTVWTTKIGITNSGGASSPTSVENGGASYTNHSST